MQITKDYKIIFIPENFNTLFIATIQCYKNL